MSLHKLLRDTHTLPADAELSRSGARTRKKAPRLTESALAHPLLAATAWCGGGRGLPPLPSWPSRKYPRKSRFAMGTPSRQRGSVRPTWSNTRIRHEKQQPQQQYVSRRRLFRYHRRLFIGQPGAGRCKLSTRMMHTHTHTLTGPQIMVAFRSILCFQPN